MTDVLPPDPLPPSEPVDDSAEAKTIRSDAPERVEEPPLPPSTRLAGRYLIVHELGRGGMGIVYRALDQWLGRQVALKVLKIGRVDDDDTNVRFLDEARLTAKLQHPAIVPVFDLGQTDDGRAFYTMRLVEGRTLAELAAAGWTHERHVPDRLTLFRALEVFAQACQAVGFAHDRGFVHRDLKPANVMVGRFGEVHVLDWGLAKQAGWKPLIPPMAAALRGAEGPPPTEIEPQLTTRDLTKSGTVMGTPAYMPPEQATGQPLDARADVYALGGTLYTLLTGKLPHEGTTSEVMWRVTWGIPPTPPSALTGAVPAALDAICMRALSHDREQRHPNAIALAEAIEGFLEGRPVGPVNPEDAEFLRSYRPTEFRRPSLTVDIVVLHAPPGATAPRAFLHRRVRSPFKGRWAIPGSFVRLEDDLETAARRTLFAETGIGSPDLKLEQLGAFGDPSRDPRTRVITIAYLCFLDDVEPPGVINAEDEADQGGWFELHADGAHDVRLRGERDEAPEPAFDHGAILAAALRRWQAR